MKQLDLYPDSPGFKDTDTSKAAAQEMQSSAGVLRAMCLEAIKRFPHTADEIAHALDRSVLAIRPRVTELKRLGRIEDTGHRRCNVSGKSAIVWRAKP